MKVVWMPLANKQLRKIARYVRKEFGSNVRDKFLQDVQEINNIIGVNPNVGNPELFALPRRLLLVRTRMRLLVPFPTIGLP